MTIAPSLTRKVIAGGFWVFSRRVLMRGLGFIRTLILARLLFPDDFGLIGVAMTVITVLDSISNIGFSQALIQKQFDREGYLDTAWTVSLIRSLALASVVYFSAPVLETFFQADQLASIIRVICISVLLSGLTNIGIISFQKNLEFHKQFFFDTLPNVVDFAVTVVAAYLLRDVWALVLGGMVGSVARLVLSYTLSGYRPRLRFDRLQMRELFDFGRWILYSSVVIILIGQGDIVFIGKMFGVFSLGLYQMAFLLSNLPATEIANAVSQVVFPSYAIIQDDLPRLREAFLKVWQFTAVLCFPLATALLVLAPQIAGVLLGEKWNDCIPLLQILSPLGCLRAFGVTATALFWGAGSPQSIMKGSIIQLGILVIFIYPASRWMGLTGTAAAFVGSYAVAEIFYARQVLRILHGGAADMLKALVIPLLASTLAALAVRPLALQLTPGLAALVVMATTGLVVYGAGLLILDAVFMCSRMRVLVVDLFREIRLSAAR